jgi:two-component system, cell cycle response regulator DivK
MAEEGIPPDQTVTRMRKKVLIVDDSHMIRRIVGTILKEIGFEVITAENGKAGCEAARAERPDLIIMDVEMPVMNGIEATARLRSDPSVSAIPILIFTSLGSDEDMRAARDAGACGFLNKPISRDELKDAVSCLLGVGGEGTG